MGSKKASSPNIADKIEPTLDRILIKPDDESMTFEGSNILRPDSAQEKPNYGTVVAIGPGRYNERLGITIPIEVDVGDRVIFAKYATHRTEDWPVLEGHVLVNEDDILAKIL